jgi:serine/threonine-protein kinase
MLAGQRVGPFDIEKQLGSGAMGAVYRARYRKTGQRVALKVLAPGLGANETALKRFEREAEVLKQFNHRNIVRFYVASQFQGTPYYAMEYVDGESFDHVLKRRGRLTWEEVVEFGKQLCAALQHAHEQGIIHRDLKPSNLMRTPDGTIKLTDFGIAKDLDVTQLTAANCTVGTAAYMSPEQCRGERNLTHKSDLYSLGVLLYELLTGQKPFQAATTMEMFLQHVQGEFERPSRLVLDIPVWLDTLVCQLLEKKPEQRPFDAAMVGQALGQVAEKVAAQQSAGIDAARARIVDRDRIRGGADETDRHAARTVLSSLKQGRRKRRQARFYEKAWFQAIGISALLLAMGGLLYFIFKPVSADTLFGEAEKMMASESSDDWTRANADDGPIKAFLNRYPNDPRVGQVKAWSDKAEVDSLSRQLHHKVQLARSFGKESQPDANEPAASKDAERIASRALRYELFGDLPSARERWQTLARKYGEDSEQRIWHLWAAQKVHEINTKVPRDTEEKETESRKSLVEKKLEEAIGQFAKNQKREGELLCKEIHSLYHADPALADLVKEARRLLMAPSKTENPPDNPNP